METIETFLWQLLAQVPEIPEENGTDALPPPFQVACVVFIILFSLFMLRKAFYRVQKSELKNLRTVEERVSDVMPKTSIVQAQITELMAELADLSRQINGQVDTRTAKLEILLREADQKIAALEGAIQGGGSAGSAPSAKGPRKGREEAGMGPNNQQANRRNPSNNPVSRENLSPRNGETQTILNMAGQGKSALFIAQEMGRPIGEIELIIALNKK